MKKLYQVLIICDDFADSPQLHKPHGALDTHTQVSTWVSSQKLRLISAAARVNQQFRLRNQHELEAVIKEPSALLPGPLQLPLRVLPQAKEHALPASAGQRGRGRAGRPVSLPHAAPPGA